MELNKIILERFENSFNFQGDRYNVDNFLDLNTVFKALDEYLENINEDEKNLVVIKNIQKRIQILNLLLVVMHQRKNLDDVKYIEFCERFYSLIVGLVDFINTNTKKLKDYEDYIDSFSIEVDHILLNEVEKVVLYFMIFGFNDQLSIAKFRLHNLSNRLQQNEDDFNFQIESFKNQIDEINIGKLELEQEIKTYKNTKKNKPAVDLYSEINNDFLKLEKKYRNLFIGAILSTLLLTIGYDPLSGIGGNLLSLGCSVNASWFDGCDNLIKPVLYPFNGDTLKFVMFKLTVLIVGVTLTTYFLRLSGFYQLKQEQAKQTKLELSAFPDFVSGMEPSVANNLRQELALKYFGKEIDRSIIEKNVDLLQEQMKAGTELIKASAEMVKTVKPSTTKEEGSEAKE